MKCPFFVEEETTRTADQCYGLAVPFEPSLVDRMNFCTTGRHRSCPLYRNACSDLSLAIQQEVTRAIG